MRILNIVQRILVLALISELLLACNVFSKPPNISVSGISYVTSRGEPRAQSVIWSPTDATKLLVNASNVMSHSSQVYILDILTMEKTPLVDTDYGAVEGSWLPDGKQIILTVEGATKTFSQAGSWIMNIKDNSLQFLSEKEGIASWLPDGNTLVLLTKDFNPPQVSIYLMNTQTKETNLIYSNPKAIVFSGFSLSPDGSDLVFSLDFSDSTAVADLYILDVQTGTVRQLTQDGASSGPQWSPIGDLIAYVKSSRVNNKAKYLLHLIHPNGTCDVEIPNLDYAFSPTWSPDGRKIAFLGEDGIYILDIDKVFERDVYKNLCQ
jgi:Tol biopolymer transport system component